MAPRFKDSCAATAENVLQKEALEENHYKKRQARLNMLRELKRSH
jgi:hypothetical protein